jgi:CTP:molybdopterin cytidylyltransferase MocA
MGGTDKLLEPLADAPILRHVLRMALACSNDVLVTLPSDGPFAGGRNDATADLGVRRILVPDASEGMAASLRAGVRAATGAAGLMVLLPDMPEIEIADIRAMISDFLTAPSIPLRAATQDGRPGHPVIFPQSRFSELSRLQGDTGGRSVFDGHPPRLHPLAGQRALVDLDTPEAWQAWRAAKSS